MNKTAAHRSIARRAVLTKAAGIATDYLATLPSQALAYSHIPVVSQLGALANMGGAIGGLITDPEKEKNPKTNALSLVPGVGNYRLSQRSRRVMDASNRRGARGTANLVAEAVGPITSSIIGAGAGGALGGALGSLRRDALGRTKAAPGAAIGAIAGSALPVLIGSIAAGIRRKRTLDEQAAADTKGRAVAKYLVPGLSQYDSLKRLGASSHLDDKSKKADKKEKKAAEAAYVEGFCKAAEAAGVDPVALYKQAGGFLDTLIGSGSASGPGGPYAPGIVSKLLANEDLRRAAVSGLTAGTTAALASDKKNRWRNALLATGLVGGGTYAASAAGILDNFISPYRAINQQAKKFQRGQHAREITRTLRGPDKGSAYEAVRGVIDRSPTKAQQLTFVNTAKK